MAQIALSNFIVFAIAVILTIYIIYLFIKRAVEKSEQDFTVREEKLDREAFLRKFIFTFLYSAMTACLIYLVASDKISAIIYFVVFLIFGLLTPKRTRKPRSGKSKIVSIVFLFLLVFLTAIWTAGIGMKIGAWLILFIIYFLGKVEEKYFISDNTGHRN